MTTFSRIVAAALLCFVIGCPNPKMPPPPPDCQRVATSEPPPDLSGPEAACKSILDAFYQRFAECGIDAHRPSYALCSGLTALAQAGTIQYDSHGAAACLATISNNNSCAFYPPSAGGDRDAWICIRKAIKGTKSDMQSCSSDYECNHGRCFTMFGPGYCIPLGTAGLGDNCGLGGRECDEDQGLFCNTDSGKCATPPQGGERCAAPEGGDMMLFLQCAPGFVCGPDNICYRRARNGEACHPGSGTPEVQECAWCATCLPNSTCHFNQRLNDPCASSYECTPGLVCTNHKCQAS